METLESSRVCRLCGKQSGISINIFDKNEGHVKKINAVLPIMVHEMDLLPKHMCHRCSYKLEEFYKFYIDCLKTDEGLKNQLSWMKKEDSNERIGIPMVHIENVKIKVEPSDYNVYDMDPIVDNVKYINSMSTVTFPVNGVQANRIHDGITYAAYTRCGCCCDKKDQSKETVSTNYERTVSRCSRLDDADERIDGCPSKLQVVKNHILNNGDAIQDRTRNLRCGEETKNTRKCQPVSSILDVDGTSSKSNRGDDVSLTSSIVRNLRPKRGSVVYAGTRKKLAPAELSQSKRRSKSTESTPMSQSKFEVIQIKLEEPDAFDERILRPRKKTIEYFEKRNYLKCTEMEQTSRCDQGHAKKYKVRNMAYEAQAPVVKIPKLDVDDRMKFAVKQEALTDMVLGESISMVPRESKRRTQSTVLDPDERGAALLHNVLANVQNDIAKYGASKRAQDISSFPIPNKFKSPASSKKRLKSEKLEFSRIDAIRCSPKNLRSQDVFLRNGKLRNFQIAERSIKKLRNQPRSTVDGDRAAVKNVMRAIKGTARTKEDSATMKLVENNIKHFCEECNVSFASKEVFSLHMCSS